MLWLNEGEGISKDLSQLGMTHGLVKRGVKKMKELGLKVGKLEERKTKLGLIDSTRFCASVGAAGVGGALAGGLAEALVDLLPCGCSI